MASFTITTAQNYDQLGVKAGYDTFNINGGTLTIDTDTRYCANSTPALNGLGPVSINAGGKLLIDGTNVRLIPYNTGSGTVPAIGTAISEGGVSAYLLGVWSALNVAPTAVGAAMPAFGYIKVKNKTGGNFSAGALTGIGATATGADVVGWIEVIGKSGSNAGLSYGSRSTAQISGAWFDLGTISGTRQQTLQAPASLTQTIYPGVWIETAAGSGTYRFWPNCSPSTDCVELDDRQKFVWIDQQGLVTIGGNGTINLFQMPATGAKVRVPNILLLNGASADPSTNATMYTAPTTVLAMSSRYSLISPGVKQFDTAMSNWGTGWSANNIYDSASYVRNFAAADQFYFGGNFADIALSQIGVGPTCANTNVTQGGLYGAGDNYKAVAWDDCVFMTGKQSSYYSNSIWGTVKLQSFNRCEFIAHGDNSNSNPNFSPVSSVYQVNGMWQDFNFVDCIFNGGCIAFSNASCRNVKFKNILYSHRTFGTCGTANAQSAISMPGGSNKDSITVDGFNFIIPTVNTCHPYGALVAGAPDYARIRNFGTFSSPLNLGTVNPCAGPATGMGAGNSRWQNIFLTAPRGQTSYSGYTVRTKVENLRIGYGSPIQALNANEVVIRGLAQSTPTYSGGTIYGAPPRDVFLSDTTGQIEFLATGPSTWQWAENAMTISGSATFDGNAYVYRNTGEIIWETPYFIKGHTGFQDALPTVNNGGAISTNTNLDYQIDLNDGNGWSAWKNMRTTGFSPASHQIGNEVVDPVLGFKLRLRLSQNTSTDASQIFKVELNTITTLAAQTALTYPLEYLDVAAVGALSGSTVLAKNPDTTAAGTYTAGTGNQTVLVGNPAGTAVSGGLVVRKVGYAEFLGTWADTFSDRDDPTNVYVAQTLNYATTNADLDAAHLAINGVAKTFAVSAAHTLLDLYQRAQWWSCQSANMIYDIPLTTKNGGTFTLAPGWTLSGVDNLTGGGVVTGSTVQLTTPGSYGGGYDSLVIDMTAAGTYNLGSATLTGAIHFGSSNNSAVTVQIPAGVSYTNDNPTYVTVVAAPVVLTLTGLQAGSDVVILDAGTSTQRVNVDANPGTTYAYNYTYAAADYVDVGVFKAGYVPYYVRNYLLGATSGSLPISQVADRNYS